MVPSGNCEIFDPGGAKPIATSVDKVRARSISTLRTRVTFRVHYTPIRVRHHNRTTDPRDRVLVATVLRIDTFVVGVVQGVGTATPTGLRMKVVPPRACTGSLPRSFRATSSSTITISTEIPSACAISSGQKFGQLPVYRTLFETA